MAVMCRLLRDPDLILRPAAGGAVADAVDPASVLSWTVGD